jgi:NAD(P)-dependent dehydrogenase (short-subunit alcohol dehydrogenase family)
MTRDQRHSGERRERELDEALEATFPASDPFTLPTIMGGAALGISGGHSENRPPRLSKRSDFREVSLQQPIDTGFGAMTTAEEVVGGQDLHGRTAIVTGGYSGLGLETVRVLAAAGARVVVPARNIDKARAALARIEGVELGSVDLLDPASIDAFAHGFLASKRPLHMLINNAGIMAPPLVRDSRGYESQFSANHLGHFQLALRLWPALVRAAGARIVAVSSRGHRLGNVDFEDPNFDRKPYERWIAYGQSKTANVLFAVEADRRGEVDGIRAFAVHPGTILSDLARHLGEDDLKAFGVSRSDPKGHIPQGQGVGDGGIFKTIAQGAATTVWCATSPLLAGKGGVYCEDGDIAGISHSADPRVPGVHPWAIDPDAAASLWSISEFLIGADRHP